MKSIFNTSDNKEIVDRINKLSPGTKSLWGKMDSAQMLAHAQAPIKVALGDVILKRGLLGILFGNIAKKKLTSDEQFKKNMPTDRTFLVRDNQNFEEEKNKLIKLVQRLADTGPDSITKDPHPFFGSLTIHEWDTLQWKHLDHHLRQFGV